MSVAEELHERLINVLVVDDRSESRAALRHVLTPVGYRVVEASSGEDALRVLLREDFAVVLLDVRMPGLDGFEVASLIRKRERTRALPIIFVTGEATGLEEAGIGYALGAVDYLVKPVAPEVVRAKVAVFAEHHRQRNQIRNQAELLREVERQEQEQKVADLRLAAERRFRVVTDAMPQIVWTARPDGTVDYVNRRWFEYTRTGLPDGGTGFIPALHPDDQESVSRAWRAALAAGNPFQAECRLKRGEDGTFRWHLARAVPESGPSGGIIEWLGTLTDIDQQKLAEAAAQEAVRLRDEFLSIASHELRTPLATLHLGVQSFVKSLEASPGAVPDRAAERLSSIERQVRRMAQLVDELLDVSRLAAGELRLKFEEVDLQALARDVVQRFDESAALSGCAIEVRADVPIVGMWDRLRVEQVLVNLLSNALKFCDKKPIEVTAEPTEATARLTVRDHGIGIKPEDQERIFGRFERASTHELGGLGLGLYITGEIVKVHGGTIAVHSQPGEGACFVVELPLARRAS
jgi:PAS domain S-box-containing protein